MNILLWCLVVSCMMNMYASQDRSIDEMRKEQFAEASAIVGGWNVETAVKSLKTYIAAYPYYKDCLPGDLTSYVSAPRVFSGRAYSVNQVGTISVAQAGDHHVKVLVSHQLQPLILAHEKSHYESNDALKQSLFDRHDMPRYKRYSVCSAILAGAKQLLPVLVRGKKASWNMVERAVKRATSVGGCVGFGSYGGAYAYRAHLYRSMETDADSHIPADTPEQVLGAVKLFTWYTLRSSAGGVKRGWETISPVRHIDRPERRLERYLQRIDRSRIDQVSKTDMIAAIAAIRRSVLQAMNLPTGSAVAGETQKKFLADEERLKLIIERM